MATSPERTPSSSDDDDAESAPRSPVVKPRPEARPAREPDHESRDSQALGALVWERSREKRADTPRESADTKDTDVSAKDSEKADEPLSPEDLQAVAELGELTPSETREVAIDGIANRKITMAAEEAGPADAAEAAAAAAADEFLDATQRRLEKDAALSVEDAANQAYQDTVDKRGLGKAAAVNETSDHAGGMEYEDDEGQSQASGSARAFSPGGGRMQPPGPNAPFAAYNAAPAGNVGANAPLWSRYAANPNTAPVRNEGAESRAFVLGLLVGGVVGNLLGRRSGRIKAEKRFKPVKERLENQVKDVYETLAFNEEKIRKLAYANETLKKQQRAAEADAKFAQKAERPIAAPNPERADAAPSPKPAAKEALPVAPVNAENMPMKELLQAAEAIEVADTNVKEIYEGGLITERAMRRIVNEAVHGGNFLSVLGAEVDAHARDHELDRQLRNRAPDIAGHTATGLPEPVTEESLASLAGHAAMRPRGPIAPPVRDPMAARESARQMLVRANITAAVVLGTLLLALAGVWLSHMIF